MLSLSGLSVTQRSLGSCSAHGYLLAAASRLLLQTDATENGSRLGVQTERFMNKSCLISWQHRGLLKFIEMGQTFGGLCSGFPFQRFVRAILDITLRRGR